MKLVTRRDGKFWWVALKDKEGVYHCIVDDSHSNKNLILAGYLYYKSQVDTLRRLHKEGKLES